MDLPVIDVICVPRLVLSMLLLLLWFSMILLRFGFSHFLSTGFTVFICEFEMLPVNA